jgi:hypothetical protein
MTCLEDGSLPWADSKPSKGQWPCPGSMFNIALPGSPGIAVYQNHYGGHYRKENSHTFNDVWIQTTRSRWCSLTLGESEHQRGE